jgi:hypothetical protein
MEGGKLQWPIWKPYEIYAKIDHVYGWPGWNNHDGFGGAQGALNAVEVVLYGLYLAIVYNHSVAAPGGRGVQVGQGVKGLFAGGRRIEGRTGNKALIIGFTAAVMTLSKTVLYCECISQCCKVAPAILTTADFNEYFSHFENVKHNDWLTLFLFYGVMKLVQAPIFLSSPLLRSFSTPNAATNSTIAAFG